jgi:hypothetical protein
MTQLIKTTSRTALKSALLKKCPEMFLRNSEDFNGNKGGIWTSAEDGKPWEKGLTPFDYYEEADYLMKDEGFDFPKSYDSGILITVREFLDKHGWYAEFHDAGTVMLYKK